MIPFRRFVVSIVTSIAIAGSAAAQNYGLTDAQMIAMGRAKYAEFHATKAGESTAAMVECQTLFGQALYRRNAALAKRVSKDRQTIILGLRRDLSAYSSSLIEISAAFSGGGTIWSPVRAGIVADVEEILYTLVGGKAPAAPARRIAEVSKILALVKIAIEKNKTEIDQYKKLGYGYGMAIDAFKGAQNTFASITAQAKKLSRAESDRILEFCRAEAAHVLEEGG